MQGVAMSKANPGFCRGWLFTTMALVTIGCCTGQTVRAQGLVADCDAAGAEASSSASIVQASGESLQRKRWQPQGGAVQFTIRSFSPISEKASFYVCFRWKTVTENKGSYVQVRPDRLDRNNDGTTWTVTATIPARFPDLAKGQQDLQDYALPLVPLAEVRILAIAEDKKLAANVTTTIGISYRIIAVLFALGTLGLALGALWIVAAYRLEHEGIKKAAWPLRIISTPSGYASLSQLQIVLWTLVVAASAVYVMSLSGDLIQVTEGTLVLLGIAGAAGVAAKVHNEAQNSKAQSVADSAEKEAVDAKVDAANAAPAEQAVASQAADIATRKAAQARTRATSLVKPPVDQTPRWSDLIFTESTRADGTKVSEIDVARFQMLLFTLITAAFVLLSVLTTYVIPDIPTGFQTLMGISNGVYLGAKVAQSTG
jgi:hypothetical protein